MNEPFPENKLLYKITIPKEAIETPISSFIYWNKEERFVYIFNEGGIVTKWSEEKNSELYYSFLIRYLPHAVPAAHRRNKLKIIPMEVELKLISPVVLLTSDYKQFRDYARKILKEDSK